MRSPALLPSPQDRCSPRILTTGHRGGGGGSHSRGHVQDGGAVARDKEPAEQQARDADGRERQVGRVEGERVSAHETPHPQPAVRLTHRRVQPHLLVVVSRGTWHGRGLREEEEQRRERDSIESSR